MTNFPFPGLNLAITTPFDDAGRIDYGRLEVNIERYLAAGVRSFLLSSGTGMHVYLSKAESEELVRRGAKIVNGRAKVIAQTSALLVEDVVERTARARDAGAEGVMVLPPFFEGPTDDEGIVDFYAEVAKSGLPVIGYNVPQAVGRRHHAGASRQAQRNPGLFSRQGQQRGFGKPSGPHPHRPFRHERRRSARSLCALCRM